MERELKPDIQEEKLGGNPFIRNLKIGVNKLRSGDRYKEIDGVWMKAEAELEATPFCRVYSDAERRLSMVELTPRGKDLLLWIMYELELNKDYVWIPKKRYMRESRISAVNTYKAALNELIRANYIVATVVSNVYWINPHYFFNGNRVKKYPNNVQVKYAPNEQ